jgi:hypothetical protein
VRHTLGPWWVAELVVPRQQALVEHCRRLVTTSNQCFGPEHLAGQPGGVGEHPEVVGNLGSRIWHPSRWSSNPGHRERRKIQIGACLTQLR